MKYLSISIVIILMVSAISCKKSSEIPALEGRASDLGTTQLAQPSSQPSTASPAPSANPFKAPPVTIPATVTAQGMNPPHGQPGHRCDIAVGVPLNSPPGTQYPSPGVTSPTNVSSQTSTTPTAPGMNPPHGQPNHRCDIAVGVPLNSPAGTGKSTSPATSQLNIPAQSTMIPTAPGMNPPHGQPNHRCDIAVGVPLDSPAGTGKTAPGAAASPSTGSLPVQIVPAPK